MSRNRYDTDTTVTTALPAAAANVDSATIDLGTETFPANESIELVVEIPATTTLVDDKDITLTVKDGAASDTLAAVTGLGTQIVSGDTGNGSDAATLRWKLPSTIRRYVAVNAAVETGGGDNTDYNFVVKLAY